MTVVFYNLEEAAEQLKLSETVLVRLSQYFKVPQLAYEQSGYLSFKGDLVFSAQDLAFFAQIKERLVLGESLDGIKDELSQYPHTQWVAVLTGKPDVDCVIPADGPATGTLDVTTLGLEPEILGGVSQALPGELPPMREIQGRQPYEKAAAQSFERYKSMHRNSLGKVFENMLKEVGSPAGDIRPATALPGFRPLRPKSVEGTSVPKTAKTPQREALLPFQRVSQSSAFVRGGLNAAKLTEQKSFSASTNTSSSSNDAVWEGMIQQATNTPRTLNIALKNAAQLLRARTLGQNSSSNDTLR